MSALYIDSYNNMFVQILIILLVLTLFFVVNVRAQKVGRITEFNPSIKMIKIDGNYKYLSDDYKVYLGFGKNDAVDISKIKGSILVTYNEKNNKIVEIRLLDYDAYFSNKIQGSDMKRLAK